MEEELSHLIKEINDRTIRMDERGKANGEKLDSLTDWTIKHEAEDRAVAQGHSERIHNLGLRIVYFAGIGGGLIIAFELYKILVRK